MDGPGRCGVAWECWLDGGLPPRRQHFAQPSVVTTCAITLRLMQVYTMAFTQPCEGASSAVMTGTGPAAGLSSSVVAECTNRAITGTNQMHKNTMGKAASFRSCTPTHVNGEGVCNRRTRSAQAYLLTLLFDAHPLTERSVDPQLHVEGR